MFRLAVAVVSLVGVVVFLTLGFLALIPREVSGILITGFLGVASWVLASPHAKEKKIEKKAQTSEVTTTKPTLAPTPRPIMNETIVVSYDEYSTYELNAKVGEEIRGKISSDRPINFYFLTKHGLRMFEEREDFSDEYGSEGCVKCDVRYVPPKTRKLYLVIETDRREKATVQVSLYILKLS